MDVAYPLSPFQAFCIAVASMDGKIADRKGKFYQIVIIMIIITIMIIIFKGYEYISSIGRSASTGDSSKKQKSFWNFL